MIPAWVIVVLAVVVGWSVLALWVGITIGKGIRLADRRTADGSEGKARSKVHSR